MDFKILGSLASPSQLGGLGEGAKTGGQQTQQAFADLVQNAVQGVVDKQKAAESLSIAAAEGQDVPMHQVIQAVSEAELTLQTMVSVRDKAVEAYQEIIRMAI